MSEQGDNIERVSQRIRAAILEFVEGRTEFRADDLRKHVAERTGQSAPGSADRVLRDLRQRGELNYQVISRRGSLYRVLPNVPPPAPEPWVPPAPQTATQMGFL